MEAIKTADVILFAHSWEDGEFREEENKLFDRIKKEFGNKVLASTIFVLTKADAICAKEGEDYQKVRRVEQRMLAQLRGIFGKQKMIYPVSSLVYSRGIREQKKMLESQSGINELREEISKIMTSQNTKIDRLNRIRGRIAEYRYETQQNLDKLSSDIYVKGKAWDDMNDGFRENVDKFNSLVKKREISLQNLLKAKYKEVQ